MMRPGLMRRALDYYHLYGTTAFVCRVLQPWRWLSGRSTIQAQLQQLAKDTQRHTTYVGDNMLLTRTDPGFPMLLDARDISVSLCIATNGSFEPSIGQTLGSLLRRGMTFVDVGANVGYFSLLGAMLVGPTGRVIAYEPDPDTCGILRKNFLLNGFLWGKAVQAALSDAGGTGVLHRAESGAGWNTMVWYQDVFPSGIREQGVEVRTTTLDEDLGAMSLDRVDVIKIDAQGSEGLIWQGMKATVKNNPQIAIICEWEPRHIAKSGVNPQRMLDEIRGMGLTVRNIGLDGVIRRAPADEELLTETEHGYLNLLLKR